MKSFTVYFDEKLTSRDVVKLKREIMAMPNVVDVEHPRRDAHGLTIDYQEAANVPVEILERLRARGLHPDVISA